MSSALERMIIVAMGSIVLSLPYGCNDKTPAEGKYDVPKTIVVNEAHYMQKHGIATHRKASDEEKLTIHTDSVNFDYDFKLVTDNYTLDKHDDWGISQVIGFFGSIPSKILLWDWDMGKGLDGERSKAVLSLLENRDDIKDLTVRLNHNEVFEDLGRLFSDEKVKDRNGFFARATVGLLSTFAGELFSELRRGDYYNPMTQTVVAYSDIEAIAAHEMGHHKDFQRFDRDWLYVLGRTLPPVMLYQEAKASLYAHDMLSEKDKNQSMRYLLPAFITYLFAAVSISKKYYKYFSDSN